MSNDLKTWLDAYIHQGAFLAKYRYHAAVVARLDPVEDPCIHVMAVSAHGRRFYLHVNVDFFVKPPANLRYLAGVLLHEVHHIVLGHLSHPKFRAAAHPDLMELAMEMSANEFIREPLPGHPVVWNDFTALGITSGQSTLERYERLVRARAAGKIIVIPVFLDEHLARGVGLCGGEGSDPGRHARLGHLIRSAVEEAGTAGGGLLAGKEPGELLETLFGTAEPPREYMDWKAALQMFVGLVRAPVHTYARPNRRFPSLVGVVPGRVYYPRQVDTPKLLVAIDTSGSMTTAELTEIGRQLQPLSDLVKITVVECDVVIQRVYPFAGRLGDVMGRGGTDLRPVFAPEFLGQHRPDGIIYFTDGEGPYPPSDPGIRTLWVLSKPQAFGCPWGQKARLSRAEV
jgi:predicted metal-dependent peptidase